MGMGTLALERFKDNQAPAAASGAEVDVRLYPQQKRERVDW